MTASEQLEKISVRTHELVTQQYNTYNRSLPRLFRSIGLNLIENHEDLTPEQGEFVDRYFREEVYPVLTPMAVDSSRPFPLVRNKSLNIAALLKKKKRAARSWSSRWCRSRLSFRGSSASR